MSNAFLTRHFLGLWSSSVCPPERIWRICALFFYSLLYSAGRGDSAVDVGTLISSLEEIAEFCGSVTALASNGLAVRAAVV